MAANNESDSRAMISSSGWHSSILVRPILERMPPQLNAWLAVIFPESTFLMAPTSSGPCISPGAKMGASMAPTIFPCNTANVTVLELASHTMKFLLISL